MAGVEALQLGTLFSNQIAVQSASSVSNDTGQFTQFLEGNQDSKEAQNTATDQITGTQKENVWEKDTVYSESAEISGTVESATEGMPYDAAKVSETVSGIQDNIRDVLKENLGITDEEIDGILDAMGIVVTDLLNPQNLQQFVLQLSEGQENLDFLTDETLMNNFSELLQDLESAVSDEMNLLLSMMEELDTPVTLEEFFVQQPEISVSADTVEDAIPFSPTEDLVSSGQTTVTMQEDAAEFSNIEEIKVYSSDAEQQEPEAETEIKTEASLQEEEVSSEGFTQQDADSAETFFSEQASKGSETVISLFSEQANTTQGTVNQLFSENLQGSQRMQQMIDIVNQVSSSIRDALDMDTTTMEVTLHPESLGKVFLSVVSKNGVMTANFQVQTNEAKNALESQIYTLRENLEAKNLKVESVDVQISNFNFEQSENAEAEQKQKAVLEKNRKRFKADSEIPEETEVSEEESKQQLRRQIMRDTGGSIDFTA